METGQRKAIKDAGYFYSRSLFLRDVKCVVTGLPDPQWHHLDEIHRNWSCFNIIPLNGDLNQKLDKRQHRSLPLELQPAVLKAIEKDHYRHGEFAQGYACARLGASLAVPRRGDVELGQSLDPNVALAFCASALLNLRPISAIPFAIDTMERGVLPILSAHRSLITRVSAARLIIELEVYFRDYGLYGDAIRWNDLVDDYVNDDVKYADRQGFRARAKQHRAITLMATGDQSPLVLMNEAAEIDGGQAYVDGQPNDLLWKARYILERRTGDIDEARDLIKKLYILEEQKRVAPWTFAEALLTDAEWHLTTDKRSKADEIVARGQEAFQTIGIVPIAILAPRCVRSFRKRYPQHLYVSPRRPHDLGRFRALALKVLEYLPTLER
jgi:hypothetical protein